MMYIDNMINRITIVWLFLLAVFIILGFLFESIFGISVSIVVLILIGIYWVYVMIELLIKRIKKNGKRKVKLFWLY